MKKVTRKIKLVDLVVDAFHGKDPIAFELRERLLRDGMDAEVNAIEFVDDSEDRRAAKLAAVARRARAYDNARGKRISA